MVIINLQGGLGNQMFQYAAARAIAPQNKTIFLDTQFLEENRVQNGYYTVRNYELDIFELLNAKRAKGWMMKLFKNPARRHKALRSLLGITSIAQKENEYVAFEQLNIARHQYLRGYFQSERYFAAIRDQILKEFTFPALDDINQSIKNTILRSANAVSIHVRRGDYLKNEAYLNIHGVLPLTYYNRAIAMLKEKYEDLIFFVFSDDMDWTKEQLNLEPFNAYYVTGNNDHNSWKDMALMSQCTHHIIANSTFSWWGAWLSAQNGSIIAPAKWFNPLAVSFNISDFIPPGWAVLDAG